MRPDCLSDLAACVCCCPCSFLPPIPELILVKSILQLLLKVHGAARPADGGAALTVLQHRLFQLMLQVFKLVVFVLIHIFIPILFHLFFFSLINVCPVFNSLLVSLVTFISLIAFISALLLLLLLLIIIIFLFVLAGLTVSNHRGNFLLFLLLVSLWFLRSSLLLRLFSRDILPISLCLDIGRHHSLGQLLLSTNRGVGHLQNLAVLRLLILHLRGGEPLTFSSPRFLFGVFLDRRIVVLPLDDFLLHLMLLLPLLLLLLTTVPNDWGPF
mmetsp:Transcript_35387/g.100196  ORF Transcript_35387/g.100196 Transcript_35387/m.100196 type:complete len:270 (-) Transcript_35387:595-1404(-)